MDRRTEVTLNAPPPFFEWWGIKICALVPLKYEFRSRSRSRSLTEMPGLDFHRKVKVILKSTKKDRFINKA